MPADDQVDLPVEVSDDACEEVAHDRRVERPVKTMKCIRPRVLIADIAFTENRFPVGRTTGVLPLTPQVRPVTWSERIPDLVREQDLAVIGLRPGPDRRRGLLVPCSDRFRILLDGPFVRPLEGQPPALEVLANPGLGEMELVQLEDQPAYLPRVHS